MKKEDSLEKKEHQLEKYISFLFEHNRKINLISRKMTHDQINRIIDESNRLAEMVSGTRVVDAGSGNGLLGIPFAIRYPERKVILLESIGKKAAFLQNAASFLQLPNLTALNCRLEDFKFRWAKKETSLVARGFPSLESLVGVLQREKIKEIVVITALSKIENLQFPLEKVSRTIYNIPFRDVIKILKMENVSRETN